jgi:hypothetical protein
VGILFVIIAFLQAAPQTNNLNTEQTVLLFLQKLQATGNSFLPVAGIMFVIGIVLLFFTPHKRGEQGIRARWLLGGCLMPFALLIAIGTVLPLIFTGLALGSLDPTTGVITNSLGFWGSVVLYVLTSWT